MMDEFKPEQEALHLDASSSSYMLETARWARFLAVIGFVAMGIIMLGAIALLFTANTSQFAEEYGNAYAAGYKTGMMLFYTILVLIFFYPLYALLKFSNLIKSAVANINQNEFDEAFRYLKNTFKFWGIYTIVLLFIYGILIVFAMAISVTANAA